MANNADDLVEQAAFEAMQVAAAKIELPAIFGVSLDKMIRRINNEPKLELMYSGIKSKSIGIVFGPSKSGKTMYCENLGMSIAAGLDAYLGKPIRTENHKVMFISFEEHYANRTERNEKQAAKLILQRGENWMDQFIVVNEKMPRYITTKEEWQLLSEQIAAINPAVVFLDSLTHMYQGAIEDSRIAIELMKNLRDLSEKTNTTVVAIHHTHKMYGQPLSIDTVAGSRVLAQETDFMIGLNRTPDGKKYIKDVAFRYIASNDDTVCTYEIGDDCWLISTGEAEESEILTANDGRRDDGSKNLILEFLQQENAAGRDIVDMVVLQNRFVATGEMSRTTVFNNIGKLLRENAVERFGKGAYKLAA